MTGQSFACITPSSYLTKRVPLPARCSIQTQADYKPSGRRWLFRLGSAPILDSSVGPAAPTGLPHFPGRPQPARLPSYRQPLALRPLAQRHPAEVDDVFSKGVKA